MRISSGKAFFFYNEKESLTELVSLLDTFDFWFNIVSP